MARKSGHVASFFEKVGTDFLAISRVKSGKKGLSAHLPTFFSYLMRKVKKLKYIINREKNWPSGHGPFFTDERPLLLIFHAIL